LFSIVQEQTMKTQITEPQTVQAVQTLFQKLAIFRSLKTDDLSLPGKQTTYEKTLEETYAALAYAEHAINTLADELEYHHARIEKAASQV